MYWCFAMAGMLIVGVSGICVFVFVYQWVSTQNADEVCSRSDSRSLSFQPRQWVEHGWRVQLLQIWKMASSCHSPCTGIGELSWKQWWWRCHDHDHQLTWMMNHWSWCENIAEAFTSFWHRHPILITYTSPHPSIIPVNLMSRSALDFDSEKNVERGIPASWSVDVLI